MRRAWLSLTVLMFFAAIGAAQVSIVSPRDGEVIRSRWLNVKVEKPTNEGYVMIWLNGKFITAITSPFEFRIDLAEQKIYSGTHTLKVAGFNKLGQKEGEAQIQFQVNLAGAESETARFVLKPKTGELVFYTFQATSETTVDVPARAIKRKVPQLSTKLILRWFQAVRDITADRQFRMMRVIEEGVLEREVPITVGAGMAMGPMGGMGPAGLTGGGMIGGGMFGGEEMGAGMFGMAGPMGMMGMGPMTMFGAPTTPGGPTMPGALPPTGGFMRIRLRPTDNQRVGLFALFPNGEIVTGEEVPNVVKFTTGSIDLTFPDRELRVGERWVGFITLPKNIENLTIIGAAMGGMPGMGGMPMMGGVPGEEYSEMPGMVGGPMMGGGPMMPGRPMMPGGPMMGMPGRPGMPGAPMMPGMSGTPLTVSGAPSPPQEPEAFLADAPVVTIPASHRFDGFEFWNDRVCARIISEFKGVGVELDLTPTTGMGQMGMGPGGMFGGAPGMPGGMMGGQMMPGAPGIGAPPTGMPGAPAGPSGQIPQPQPKLTGKADGTRTLLFDIENGQVVYVKVTVKATFDTDLVTVLPFVQDQQQLAGAPGMTGAPGAPTTPGGMMGGMPGFMGGMPGGMFGGGMLGGFGMPGGEAPFGGLGGFGGAPFGGAPFGGLGGFGGAPFGGAPFGGLGGFGGSPYTGGTPTAPNPFGRFGMGTFGPTGGSGMAGIPSWGGMTGMPQQPTTFRNHPAKLLYSLTLENTLTHSGRLDQQLKALTGG
ncbi:hypothetical protein Q2T83_13085 [Fervidibacter sacchari]|uniref:Uncharacterized protein n=1 Tax=Candidatus Fervidibacter sacchari TaxID=1448929 RepID=A0ABT2ENM9_9BACT|nr:hypothetical protein [Candidatus Fervidibacter sacchari]MCS3919536.1 hypothetical protein [Candidatus Fervidibacter sacchari]WKU15260.1 hypothetical protein Q2T83_13085 [Candidatus Fervidibacter sacchari]